jgi:hypothetical protein
MPYAQIDTLEILGYLNTDHSAMEMHARPVTAMRLIKNEGTSLNIP